jgi:hypothetical protein
VSKTSSSKVGVCGELGAVRERCEGLKMAKSHITTRSQRARARCLRLVPWGSWIMAATLKEVGIDVLERVDKENN